MSGAHKIMPRKPAAAYGVPSREDYFDFLIRCYFGDGQDALQLCVRRAYLDLNRTLHGFAGHGTADQLRRRRTSVSHSWSRAWRTRRRASSRYELVSCPLYISRGIGTSIAPLRIGARPRLFFSNYELNVYHPTRRAPSAGAVS